VNTVATFAGLTLLEAARRRVLWALIGLAAVVVGLSSWGFARLPGLRADGSSLSTGQAHLAAVELLSFIVFTLSFVGALGLSFVASPTLAGELESGTALSMLARPVRRWQVLGGKWVGLSLLAAGYVVVVGGAEIVAVEVGTGYRVPDPAAALALLAAQAVCLLSLALLLSTVLSALAAGVVTVGIFGLAWVAGLVGDIGVAVHNTAVARVGAVGHIIVPTDGLWRGVMHALDSTSILHGFSDEVAGNPFMQPTGLRWSYLVWVALWIAGVLAVANVRFGRAEP